MSLQRRRRTNAATGQRRLQMPIHRMQPGPCLHPAAASAVAACWASLVAVSHAAPSIVTWGGVGRTTPWPPRGQGTPTPTPPLARVRSTHPGAESAAHET